MPYLLQCLFRAAYPTDPMLCKTTYNVFIHKSPWRWPIRGRRTHSIPKRLHRKKKPSMHLQTESTIKAKLRTFLVSIAVSAFKAGCCVEGRLRELLASHRPRELQTKLHCSVKCGRLHQSHPLQLQLLSHQDRYPRHALHGQRTSPF
jgi:hypothetical protein